MKVWDFPESYIILSWNKVKIKENTLSKILFLILKEEIFYVIFVTYTDTCLSNFLIATRSEKSQKLRSVWISVIGNETATNLFWEKKYW